MNMEITYRIPSNAENSCTSGKFINLGTKTPPQDGYAFLFTPLFLQLHPTKTVPGRWVYYTMRFVICVGGGGLEPLD